MQACSQEHRAITKTFVKDIALMQPSEPHQIWHFVCKWRRLRCPNPTAFLIRISLLSEASHHQDQNPCEPFQKASYRPCVCKWACFQEHRAVKICVRHIPLWNLSRPVEFGTVFADRECCVPRNPSVFNRMVLASLL